MQQLLGTFGKVADIYLWLVLDKFRAPGSLENEFLQQHKSCTLKVASWKVRTVLVFVILLIILNITLMKQALHTPHTPSSVVWALLHPHFLFSSIVGLRLYHVGLAPVGSSDVRPNKSHWDAPYKNKPTWKLNPFVFCCLFLFWVAPVVGCRHSETWEKFEKWWKIELLVLFIHLHAAVIVFSRQPQIGFLNTYSNSWLWVSVLTFPFCFVFFLNINILNICIIFFFTSTVKNEALF